MGGNDYALAHYYIALIHIKTGKDAEAARALKAYLEAAPNGAEAENARMLLKQISPP
jgi:TolA-binding protein